MKTSLSEFMLARRKSVVAGVYELSFTGKYVSSGKNKYVYPNIRGSVISFTNIAS